LWSTFSHDLTAFSFSTARMAGGGVRIGAEAIRLKPFQKAPPEAQFRANYGCPYFPITLGVWNEARGAVVAPG
jgi:hypothetical protein